MGVARAVLATLGAETAARVLADEFGWDAAVQALPSAVEVEQPASDPTSDDRSLRS